MIVVGALVAWQAGSLPSVLEAWGAVGLLMVAAIAAGVAISRWARRGHQAEMQDALSKEFATKPEVNGLGRRLDEFSGRLDSTATRTEANGIGGKVDGLTHLLTSHNDRIDSAEDRILTLETEIRLELRQVSQQLEKTASLLDRAAQRMDVMQERQIRMEARIDQSRSQGGGK